MPEKCSLEGCMLVDDIAAIKKTQADQSTSQGKRDIAHATFEQKMLDYMDQGKKEHDLMFNKNKDQDIVLGKVVTWPTVYKVVGALVAVSMLVIAIITIVISVGGNNV